MFSWMSRNLQAWKHCPADAARTGVDFYSLTNSSPVVDPMDQNFLCMLAPPPRVGAPFYEESGSAPDNQRLMVLNREEGIWKDTYKRNLRKRKKSWGPQIRGCIVANHQLVIENSQCFFWGGDCKWKNILRTNAANESPKCNCTFPDIFVSNVSSREPSARPSQHESKQKTLKL